MLPTEDIYLPLSEFMTEDPSHQEPTDIAHLIIAVVIWIIILSVATILLDTWIKKNKR